MPSEAEARGSDFADVEFYLSKTGIGDTYDIQIEEPTSDRPKYWKARDDPNQANSYFPLVNFEQNMGGSLALGDSFHGLTFANTNLLHRFVTCKK